MILNTGGIRYWNCATLIKSPWRDWWCFASWRLCEGSICNRGCWQYWQKWGSFKWLENLDFCWYAQIPSYVFQNRYWRQIKIHKYEENQRENWNLNSRHAWTMLGFHAFTGCDTVSSFAGNPNHVSAFKSLGESSTIREGVLEILEDFVCALYGGDGSNVNEIRYI
jgi:hypothetical protein